jgi:hypothetical protein
MIAKRLLRSRTKDSFQRLGQYILSGQEKGAKRPSAEIGGTSWQRTAGYVLDLPGAGHRVGAVRISNCTAAEPADAIAEIAATQAMNLRARGDKTYHLVVSFPPGETPTPEQFHDIEDELCAAIGLASHQRISAVHTDTDHLHIHIAISKVHPVTRRCIEPFYDQRKLMAACDGLEIKHGLERTNHGERKTEMLRGRGADMEAHSGQEALLAWIRDHVLEDIQACLRNGRGWQDLHRVLARYDLDIRPRGAGLALVTADGKLGVRASRISRALSQASLTRRWGAYEALTGTRPPARMRYERAPKRKSVRSTRLWEEYQQRRDVAKAAREAAFAQYREDADRRWHALSDWKQDRLRIIRNATDLTAAGRAHRAAKFETEEARAERDLEIWKRDSKAAISVTHALPTWFGFLREKAAAGNSEALEILRERETRQLRAGEAFAAADGEGEARTVVFSALRPHCRKNGDMVYHLRDGGRVTDRQEGLLVEAITPHALFLTLSLQAERSPGRAMTLGGDAHFQAAMVEMAAAKAMDLSFADRQLEQRRRELMGLPPVPEPPPAPRSILARLGLALTGGMRPRRA